MKDTTTCSEEKGFQELVFLEKETRELRKCFGSGPSTGHVFLPLGQKHVAPGATCLSYTPCGPGFLRPAPTGMHETLV